jgi:hypothetical protein
MNQPGDYLDPGQQEETLKGGGELELPQGSSPRASKENSILRRTVKFEPRDEVVPIAGREPIGVHNVQEPAVEEAVTDSRGQPLAPDTAYPTMQRRRQKAKHKAAKEGKGPEPKRKPQQVEQHFDDCGEYFSPLDIGNVEPASEHDDSDDDERPMFDAYYGMNGSEYEFERLEDNTVRRHPDAYREFDSIDAFLQDPLHDTTAAYDDVAQLCGGAGDTAALLVRRDYVDGPNYDLVAGFNALSPDAMRQVERYVKVHKPRIMVLSTPCTGMKRVRIAER